MRTNRLLKMAAAYSLFLATAMQFGCGGGYIKPKSSESDSDASDTEPDQPLPVPLFLCHLVRCKLTSTWRFKRAKVWQPMRLLCQQDRPTP